MYSNSSTGGLDKLLVKDQIHDRRAVQRAWINRLRGGACYCFSPLLRMGQLKFRVCNHSGEPLLLFQYRLMGFTLFPLINSLLASYLFFKSKGVISVLSHAKVVFLLLRISSPKLQSPRLLNSCFRLFLLSSYSNSIVGALFLLQTLHLGVQFRA